MTIHLASLEIVDAVIHDVPRPETGEALTLTEAPVALDPELETYFRDKLKESLQGRGLRIQADPDLPPVVRNEVAAILGDPGRHVAASQEMAMHLYDLQKKTNSPGLLTVIRARAAGQDLIAILKLEREVGVHVVIDEEEAKRVINLEFLRDLTLTRKTRVFKAAVVELVDGGDPLTMQGLASDDQRSRTEGRGLARFFLHDFLGCQLSASAEKATKDFWNAAQTFINEDVASPEKKGRYQVAVQAFLEEPEEDLRPETFIQSAIDLNDQPKLRQRVRDEGLEPATTVPKDTALIARKISGFRVTFAHGMALVGAREDLEERIDLPSQNGSGPTTIRDTIKTMSGR
ncbi:MAG TPA: nucleoid-associated protein [Solirubrobacterales bacterium]|nr:nucleoid-associated protein [Solirubrobacterales bacterium]